VCGSSARRPSWHAPGARRDRRLGGIGRRALPGVAVDPAA